MFSSRKIARKLHEEVAVAERTAIYDDMNRVMATRHSVRPQDVGLQDYGREGHFLER